MRTPLRVRRQLGEFLRLKRLEAGLTQLDLAGRLGWRSPQQVSIIERGLYDLSVGEAPRYCHALGLTKTGKVQKLILERETACLRELFSRDGIESR